MEELETLLVWCTRVVLSLALATAVTSDIRWRRIPNWLALATLLTGLAWSGFMMDGRGLFDRYYPGSPGFGTSLLGASGVFVLFFALYLFRAVGAGDVKFMTAVASFFSAPAIPGLVLYVFASAALIVAVRAVDAHRRAALAYNLRVIWYGAIGGGAGPTFNPKTDTADRLPFAIAIALGTVVFSAKTYFDF